MNVLRKGYLWVILAYINSRQLRNIYAYLQCRRRNATPNATVSFTNFVPSIVFGGFWCSTHCINAASTLFALTNGTPAEESPPPWPNTQAPGPELQWNMPEIRKKRKNSSSSRGGDRMPRDRWWKNRSVLKLVIWLSCPPWKLIILPPLSRNAERSFGQVRMFDGLSASATVASWTVKVDALHAGLFRTTYLNQSCLMNMVLVFWQIDEIIGFNLRVAKRFSSV